MTVLVTDKKEMNSILSQSNINYDCVEANEKYVVYQIYYYDSLKYLVGIKEYKFLCPLKR